MKNIIYSIYGKINNPRKSKIILIIIYYFYNNLLKIYKNIYKTLEFLFIFNNKIYK